MTKDIRPQYSITRVNKAGKNVRINDFNLDDLIVIENWRSCHNHILNAWQALLRGRCKTNKQVVFAQRLKRQKTIFDKLEREPKMALAKMHDIAGCRLIFKDIKSLHKYRDSLHKARFKHTRVKSDGDPYNYILNPATSGYRGIHDVYKFCSKNEAGRPWDGLQVEIQYRTTFQHAWATAVEVAGSLTGNHTKFDRGSKDYKRFFSLSSEIIARVFEQSKSCHYQLSNKQLVKQFKNVEKRIKLLKKLKSVKAIKNVLSKSTILKKRNLLLIYREADKQLYLQGFLSLSIATEKYFELERAAAPDDDIVLVRADTQDNIKQAFKNYFSDTEDFVFLIEKGLKELSGSNG